MVAVDTRTVIEPREQPHVPLSTALGAVIASTLLRAPWFLLALLMPRTAAGLLVFCLVLVSAGVVLLHWCLGWFGWTIPLRGAVAARVLPAIVAVAATGAFGLRTSVPVLIGMGVLEFLLATTVVTVQATPLDDAHGITGFEEGELLSLRWDDEPLPAEERYARDVASLVREARGSRLRTSA